MIPIEMKKVFRRSQNFSFKTLESLIFRFLRVCSAVHMCNLVQKLQSIKGSSMLLASLIPERANVNECLI